MTLRNILFFWCKSGGELIVHIFKLEQNFHRRFVKSLTWNLSISRNLA